MRVALIVPGFSADENDWCIPALLNFVRALSRQLELEVFTLRYPHRRGDYCIGHASVHSLGWAQQRDWRSITLWLAAVRAIVRRHQQKPFDVLHAFWADEPAWIGAACARQLSIPLVVSLAGGELSHLPQIGYGLQRHLIQRQFIRWSLQAATRVTAGSTYLCDLARARGITSVSFAPLGVDTEMFNPASQVQRPESNVDNPTFRLLNVGSFAAVKGQALLLQTMRRVIVELPMARLRMIGEGPLKHDLLSAITRLGLREHVTLCDAIAHEQLPRHYRVADLFVQSSLHEAQGMAVLEAAACGVPIVGTAVGVLHDLAPDAACGVPVADERALADAIINLLCADTKRQTMGHAARAHIEEFYGVETCMQRFVALYRESLSYSKNG